jgi:type II secretory pathway pseudopilin PulG
MPHLGLISLLVALAVLASMAALAVRGLAAWKDSRRVLRRVNTESEMIVAGLEDMQRRVDRLNSSNARLEGARAQLDRSLAAARLLFAATGDARSALKWLRFLAHSR